MKTKYNKYSHFAVVLLMSAAFFSFTGCKKDPKPKPGPVVIDSEMKAKNFLKSEYMDVYYYWYDLIPQNVDASKYDIYHYFNALLYSKDRWSWMMDKKSFISSETGVVSGTYGASIKQAVEYYKDYSVRVKFVYPDSPFAKEGVKRGWTLTHIDGETVDNLIKDKSFNSKYSKSPQTFTFKDLKGDAHTFTATAASALNTRPGLLVKVFGKSDYSGLNESVGYFHYLAFKAEKDALGKSMIDDIKEAMSVFREAGVKKLILDLRYNGGGDSRASDTLAYYLAPKSAEGKVFVSRRHNKMLAKQDKSSKISRLAGSLDLDALYVITGSGSASASEMILNGLKPLMNVHHVGDTTYGKPNGMYVLMYPGEKSDHQKYDQGNYDDLKYVFLPICFYNKNGNGEDIPDSGMIPENYRADDLYHDFDVNEDNIAACLYHIVNGKYPELPPVNSVSTRAVSGKYLGISEEESNPKYGTYLVRKKDIQLP